jgi:radical SAM superfamily enzyme YgiQ (UPF0313 family)
MTWACQARVDTFSDAMARAMRSAGCVQVDFGVESGSQRVLDYTRKNIKLEETKRAFRIARDNGLRVLATVMVGLPTERPDDFEMTKKLMKEIRPDFVAPSFTMPYPGTELHSLAKRNGWIDASKDPDWRNSGEPSMASGMSASEIKKAFDELLSYNRSAYFEYLTKPAFLMDLSKVFLRRPGYIGRLLAYAISGRGKDITDLFLYIFRKEILSE